MRVPIGNARNRESRRRFPRGRVTQGLNEYHVAASFDQTFHFDQTPATALDPRNGSPSFEFLRSNPCEIRWLRWMRYASLALDTICGRHVATLVLATLEEARIFHARHGL